jgi:hypothetical protein|nr:MAG TPA: Theoretical tuberculin protein [Bacteriophage sp.]
MKDGASCAVEMERVTRWSGTIRHIFGGAYRNKSEKYGLVVYLCGERCHRNGGLAVHRNGNQMRLLRRYGQLKAMQEQGWTEDDFRREFGKSYL